MFKDSSFFSCDYCNYYYFFSYDGIGYCIPSFLSSHWKSIDKSPKEHIYELCEFVLLASSPSSSFWQVCSMITALGIFLFCVFTWRMSDEMRQKTKNQMKHASLYCWSSYSSSLCGKCAPWVWPADRSRHHQLSLSPLLLLCLFTTCFECKWPMCDFLKWPSLLLKFNKSIHQVDLSTPK